MFADSRAGTGRKGTQAGEGRCSRPPHHRRAGAREAPAGGALDPGRGRQGLDALPGGREAACRGGGKGPEGGGEGAGQRLRPGEEGGGELEGGCLTANTHTGRPGTPVLRDAQGDGGLQGRDQMGG